MLVLSAWGLRNGRRRKTAAGAELGPSPGRHSRRLRVVAGKVQGTPGRVISDFHPSEGRAEKNRTYELSLSIFYY
jgi:hypothetical protein